MSSKVVIDDRLVFPRSGLTSATSLDGGFVPKFASNLSVHVVSTEHVILSSEERKFALTSPVYVALATRIDGERSLAAILHDLHDYPEDAVRTALTRLAETGLVVDSHPDEGSNGAFWASFGIGLKPLVDALKRTTIEIGSNVDQATERLVPALDHLGIKVAEARSSAVNFSILVTDDYLGPDAEAYNAERLHDGRQWILLKPAGNVALLGPVFTPGGLCWKCVASRIQRNRQVASFLSHRSNGAYAVSSSRDHVRAPGIYDLFAVEIAKAIALGPSSTLHDHMLSFDFLSGRTASHFVVRKPGCSACGGTPAENAENLASRAVMRKHQKDAWTSGGLRVWGPDRTLEICDRHISPLTGVVTSLQRVAGCPSWMHIYTASHAFDPRPRDVEALKKSVAYKSSGKGTTAEQAKASAVCEAIERHSGVFCGDEPRYRRRYRDGEDELIHPNRCMLFSDRQYAAASGGGPALPQLYVPARFDEDMEIDWSPVWSLRDKRSKFLPTSFLYYFYEGPGADMCMPTSNGAAAGNTWEEALVHGFLELVERDAFAIWWYNRLKKPQVSLDGFDDYYLQRSRAWYRELDRDLWLLDLTSDIGIPVFVAVSRSTEGEHERIEFGSGCHFDPRIAALRAVTELNQHMVALFQPQPEGQDPARAARRKWWQEVRIREHEFLAPAGPVVASWRKNPGYEDQIEEVLACLDCAKKADLEILFCDQTRSDVGLPVCKVIVPGLRHFWPRFAPGRLYTVPARMGAVDRELDEDELNTLVPLV